MGLFNHFPYPDTHQLNLDWILDAVKTCVDKAPASWPYVREPGTAIQKALTDAQAAAASAQESVRDITTMFAKLYPVGSVYVNYRNQTMPVESDATVIARLQALTGGTWARAGSRGQRVTETGKLGMATIILTNGGGDYKETNFNIYVRTA